MIILGSKEVIHAFYSADKSPLVLSSIRTNIQTPTVRYKRAHPFLLAQILMKKGAYLLQSSQNNLRNKSYFGFYVLFILDCTYTPRLKGGGGSMPTVIIGLYKLFPVIRKKRIVFVCLAYYTSLTFPTSRIRSMLFCIIVHIMGSQPIRIRDKGRRLLT
jgi:hypothetical protein